MPWGFQGYGFGQQQPTTQGDFSLADIWAPTPRPEIPEPPSPVTNLSPEQRKALRRQMLIEVARGLGNARPGMLGSGLADAAQGVEDFRSRQLADANTAQAEDYQRRRLAAEGAARADAAGAEDAKKKASAEAVLGAYHEIVAQEPAWAARARAAAVAGRIEDLAKMQGQLEERKWRRDHGEDPADPYASDRAKKKIEDDAILARKKEEHSLDVIWKKEALPADIERARAMSRAAAEGQAPVYAQYRDRGEDAGLSQEEKDRHRKEVREAEGWEIKPREVTDAKGKKHTIHVRMNKYTGRELEILSASELEKRVDEAQKSLGRPLTIEERTKVRHDISAGATPGGAVILLRYPVKKPIDQPKTAPTQGSLPLPPQKRGAAKPVRGTKPAKESVRQRYFATVKGATEEDFQEFLKSPEFRASGLTIREPKRAAGVEGPEAMPLDLVMREGARGGSHLSEAVAAARKAKGYRSRDVIDQRVQVDVRPGIEITRRARELEARAIALQPRIAEQIDQIERRFGPLDDWLRQETAHRLARGESLSSVIGNLRALQREYSP